MISKCWLQSLITNSITQHCPGILGGLQGAGKAPHLGIWPYHIQYLYYFCSKLFSWIAVQLPCSLNIGSFSLYVSDYKIMRDSKMTLSLANVSALGSPLFIKSVLNLWWFVTWRHCKFNLLHSKMMISMMISQNRQMHFPKQVDTKKK